MGICSAALDMQWYSTSADTQLWAVIVVIAGSCFMIVFDAGRWDGVLSLFAGNHSLDATVAVIRHIDGWDTWMDRWIDG